MPPFLQSNIISKCINLLKNFPIGNVVNYLYCNDLFMFITQDFLHGHKPLLHAVKQTALDYITIGDFHTNADSQILAWHFSMPKSYHERIRIEEKFCTQKYFHFKKIVLVTLKA